MSELRWSDDVIDRVAYRLRALFVATGRNISATAEARIVLSALTREDIMHALNLAPVEAARREGMLAGMLNAAKLAEEASDRRRADAKDPELTRKIGMAHMHLACAEQCEGLANFIRAEAEKVRNG